MEHFSPYVHFLGLYFDIPTMISTVVSMFLVLLIAMMATRNMSMKKPRGAQNFLEWVIEFVRGIARQNMDNHTAEKYVTLALTLFLYLFIANQVGLMFNFTTVTTQPNEAIGVTQERIDEAKQVAVQKDPEHAEEAGLAVTWWKSPTATPSVTFSLAILVLLYSHYLGIKKSPVKYLKPYWSPLHWLEEASKFLTLPLRLFGNIFAGEVLVAVLVGASWYVTTLPLVVWLGYSVFVGAIQAFIFTTLTMVYIAQKIADEGH